MRSPSAELVSLLDTLFDLFGHKVFSLPLCEVALGNFVNSLLIGSIEAIGVEHIPAVCLLARLFLLL